MPWIVPDAPFSQYMTETEDMIPTGLVHASNVTVSPAVTFPEPDLTSPPLHLVVRALLDPGAVGEDNAPRGPLDRIRSSSAAHAALASNADPSAASATASSRLSAPASLASAIELLGGGLATARGVAGRRATPLASSSPCEASAPLWA